MQFGVEGERQEVLDILGESKKYTRLMSHKKVTITSILNIWIGFDSKNLKLDNDMKNNHFVSLSIGLLIFKQSMVTESYTYNIAVWTWR